MTSTRIDNLRKQLGGARDGALLRFSLGQALLAEAQAAAAIVELRAALVFTPTYSAAWKLLGQALTETGEHAAAIEAYRQGIAVAHAHGDNQAAKEMQVFLRRIERARPSDTDVRS